MNPVPALILLSLTVSIGRCAVPPGPPEPRSNFQGHGRIGQLNLLERLQDAIGTAVQVWKDGPKRQYDVLHSARDGPISAVYRQSLTLSAAGGMCTSTKDADCVPAIGGFGTTTEVHYTFYDQGANLRGSSTQIQLGVRCLAAECNRTLLMRQVDVYERVPPGEGDTPIRRTCLYEKSVESGQFSDGHAELLRMTARKRGEFPKYTEKGFVYMVSNADNSTHWRALGERAFTRKCSAAEVAKLPRLDPLDDAENKRNIGSNDHTTEPHNNCGAPAGAVYYQEMDDAGGTECARLFDYAAAAAANKGTSQDVYAIGGHPETYKDEKPGLVSDTELALVCSAAALGVLCACLILRKQFKKPHTSMRSVVAVLVIEFLTYILEALPLHLAMIQEMRAMRWSTQFSFLDASMVLSRDNAGAQGSSVGNVLISTAVIGYVEYFETRYGWLIGLTVVFDVVAIGVLVRTVQVKMRIRSRAVEAGVHTRMTAFWQWFWGGESLEQNVSKDMFGGFGEEEVGSGFGEEEVGSGMGVLRDDSSVSLAGSLVGVRQRVSGHDVKRQGEQQDENNKSTVQQFEEALHMQL